MFTTRIYENSTAIQWAAFEKHAKDWCRAMMLKHADVAVDSDGLWYAGVDVWKFEIYGDDFFDTPQEALDWFKDQLEKYLDEEEDMINEAYCEWQEW